MAILRIQQASASYLSAVVMSLPQTPLAGNTLIAVIGSTSSSDVSSITQDGVEWRNAARTGRNYGYMCEIWYGSVLTDASSTLIVNFSGSLGRVNLTVCEYFGIKLTNPLDQTQANSGANGSPVLTGATGLTVESEELWVGGTVGIRSQSSTQQSYPTNGFTLIGGQQEGSDEDYFLSLGYLEKIVSSTGHASTGTTQQSTYSYWAACIVTFKSWLTKDGRLSGRGSKQTVIHSSADPIIDVPSNFGDWEKSAVIENLVLIGNGANTAIRLQDVYNCQIRNVTIKNCRSGIWLTATNNRWSESNSVKHVRIESTAFGVVFEKGAGTGSFGFTNVSDVSILLPNIYSTGIVVSNGAKLNNCFINCNVQLGANSYNGIGMYIDNPVSGGTEIKCGLVRLHVIKSGSQGGTGVYFTNSTNSVILNNQDLKTRGEPNKGFFLTTKNVLYATVLEPPSEITKKTE
ncbi:MAG: hypothetical protein ACQCN3_07155 [Candidatus Bathyarchaeia archaeon]